MVVEVYPIKRLPRRFEVFDYLIPDDLEIKRGNFVLVPWRNRQIWGVVAKVKAEPIRDIKLKTVSEIMDGLLLSEQEMSFYEQTAFDLVQSVGSILHAAFPKVPKRSKEFARRETSGYSLTLPKSEIPNVRDVFEQASRQQQGFVLASDLRRTAVMITGLLHTNPKEANLVICPNVRDAELLVAGLHHLKPILVSGKETPIARWQAWQAWREQGGLFIGTRLSALLLHPAIKNVFLVRSGQQNHKQEDRNPRYDTRQLAKYIQHAWPARLWQIDVVPRVDDLAVFADNEFLGKPNATSVFMVDKQKEKTTAPHPALGYSTVQMIEETLLKNQKVVGVYNRKGVSRQLKCNDCGYTFPCGTCQGRYLVYEHTIRCHRCDTTESIPLDCPRCHKKDLWHQGFGNRLIARALQKLFPQNTVGLIEKGDSLGASLNADILVVTNYWLENIFNPFTKSEIGLVVDLDADMALYEPSFRSLERAFINLEEWRGVAQAFGAKFVIQTDSLDLYQKYLENPKLALANELTMRQEFGQPPSKRWVRITTKDVDQRQAEVDLNLIKQAIKKIDDQAMFLGPKPEAGFEAGFKPEQSNLVLKELAKLDDGYIIDSNVNL